MAAGALLTPSLYFSGSILSTGAPNSSGLLYAYLPNTTTPVTLYRDRTLTSTVTQPVTLDTAGKIPYATYPNGVWTAQPCQVLVQDVNGNTVSNAIFTPATAGDVSVGNAGYTGSNLQTGALQAGGLTTTDAVLSSLFASVGGVDAQYQESGGAIQRPIQDKFREIWISVKDFGAVGNGVAIDTTGCQSAINRAKALNGAVVYFPPGTYKIDQALAITSATGIRLVGAGSNTTTVSCTNSSADGMTFTSCTGCSVESLAVIHASSSTGAAVTVSGCTDFLAWQTALATGSGTFAYGLRTVATTTRLRCERSVVAGTTNALQIVGTNQFWVTACQLSAAAATIIDIQTTSNYGKMIANDFLTGATTAIKFNANLSGQYFAITDSPTLGTTGFFTTPVDVTGVTNAPFLTQRGNGLPILTTSSAVGASQTPIVILTEGVKLTAASGGAGTVTVNNPSFFPANVDDGRIYTFTFVNSSGGAVTWSLGTAYKFASVPTTDGHTIEVAARYDGSSHFRQIAQTDLAT